MNSFTESIIEETELKRLKDIGYIILFGGVTASEKVLTSLRDSLSMPKLVRGEVRVKA